MDARYMAWKRARLGTRSDMASRSPTTNASTSKFATLVRTFASGCLVRPRGFWKVPVIVFSWTDIAATMHLRLFSRILPVILLIFFIIYCDECKSIGHAKKSKEKEKEKETPKVIVPKEKEVVVTPKSKWYLYLSFFNIFVK